MVIAPLAALIVPATVLIETGEGDSALKDLLLFGFKRNLQIDIEEVDGVITTPKSSG